MLDFSKMKPDYKVYSDGQGEGFNMYILRRNATGYMKPDIVEGIAQDFNGDFAVFAGQMTHRDIQFVKRYSPGVTQVKFKGDVSYTGTIGEDGRITGEYETRGGTKYDHNGTFTMHALEEAVAQ